MFWKKKIVKLVYNAYIDGLTVEEICDKFKYIYYKRSGGNYTLSEKEVNEIIDGINLII